MPIVFRSAFSFIALIIAVMSSVLCVPLSPNVSIGKPFDSAMRLALAAQ